MQAGQLINKIIIQYKTITQDDELNSIETWTTLKALWAESVSKVGKEYYKLAVVNSEITQVFRTRYATGITSHQRLIFKGLNYEILDVVNVGELNAELLLTCKVAV